MTFTAPKRPVSRVFLHCSASDRPEHDNPETIRRWHLERGFSEIGYHFVCTQDGTLHTGRHLERPPAAQQGHNIGSIAVCLTGLEHFSEAQFDTLRALCQAIHAELPLATFHGHSEVSAKSCPVYDYRAVLGLNACGGADVKLVVNRRTAPKPRAKPKRATVKAVLSSCLDAASEFDAVLIVAHRRDGPTQMAWSDQRNGDLVWLAEFAAHNIKQDVLKE